MAIIYKVTNKINGKIYIGKSKYNQEDYFGSGLKIGYAIAKYGIENFTKEIIQECSDDEIDTAEIFWIEELNARDEAVGYNISAGGQGGDHYWKVMNESERELHKQKIRNGVAKRIRYPHSEETKKKISLNQNQSPEIKEKRAAAKRIKYIIFDHKERIVYTTDNIKTFCVPGEDLPSYDKFQYNERNKKTFLDGRWSCRRYNDYAHVTIESIEEEVRVNTEKYKRRMIESRNKNV